MSLEESLERISVFNTFFGEEQQKQWISKCSLAHQSVGSNGNFWQENQSSQADFGVSKRYEVSLNLHLWSLTKKTLQKSRFSGLNTPLLNIEIKKQPRSLDKQHILSPLSPSQVFGVSPFFEGQPQPRKITRIYFSTTDLMPTFTTFGGDYFFGSEKKHREPPILFRLMPPRTTHFWVYV